MAYITKHAVQRTKQRVGLPKSAAARNADRALRDGIQHNETSGGLHRYIEALYWRHCTANNIRIYCNNVYIFHDDILITLFPLPGKYRKTAAKLWKELRK